MPLLTDRSVRICAIVTLSLVLGACQTPQHPGPNDSAAAAASAATPPARGSEVAAAPSSGVAGTMAESTSRRAAPRDMSVYFEFDSSALSDAGQRVVREHAEFLGGARQPVRLEGNADERGSREYNIALGQRRADAVRQMLVLRGMPSERVDAVSYGEERPRCGESSETCFATNRRVDFVYSGAAR